MCHTSAASSRSNWPIIKLATAVARLQQRGLLTGESKEQHQTSVSLKQFTEAVHLFHTALQIDNYRIDYFPLIGYSMCYKVIRCYLSYRCFLISHWALKLPAPSNLTYEHRRSAFLFATTDSRVPAIWLPQKPFDNWTYFCCVCEKACVHWLTCCVCSFYNVPPLQFWTVNILSKIFTTFLLHLAIGNVIFCSIQL